MGLLKGKIFNASILLIVSFIIFAVLLGLIYTGVINEYYALILTLAGINTIVALGLNLITGFTGQLVLGQAGFMMVGAYTTGIILIRFDVPIFAAIIAGGIVAGIFGLFIGIPTLRLRGDYLAITTLGFGEILRVIINNLDNLTGGASGLKGIPTFTDDYLMKPVYSFIWVFWFCVLAILIVGNLIRSSHGRAIISIREDEIAANSMGINVSFYKMFAFIMSAFLAGVGGGLYALLQQYLDPKSTGFLSSVFFVVYVVFGGLGSITGTVVSTVVLTYMQEVLRFLGSYRLVFFGLLLIVMMIFWPKGLFGTKELSIVKPIRKFLAKVFKLKGFEEDSGPVSKSSVQSGVK
ncbi:MAG: branched-chain amino acid ABC transporter permease [Clostridia bacterium]|nr:branched-chain amino acid ABC transporter permease [Clostridia bacterium]